MGARAGQVERTRSAIVQAARELHASKGLAATSWDEIAARAGVSTATAYRHFPSLAELVPACARTVFDIIQPPTLAEATSTFAALERASARFEHLVRSTCHCYVAGADWLHAAYRERDFVPELDNALRVIEDSLRVLIAAAARRPLAKTDQRLLFVLCNFPLWMSLRADGVSANATEEMILRLVTAEVQRVGLDDKE
jgi:AcrR family transcriptional regulator